MSSGVLRHELLKKTDRHREGEFQFRGRLSIGQEGVREEFQKEPFRPLPVG